MRTHRKGRRSAPVTHAMGVLLLGAVLLSSGCSAPRGIAYMQDAVPGTSIAASPVPVAARPGDKISIVVNSKNPELADMFNLPIMTHRIGQQMNSSYSGNQQVSSYTVDDDGDIDFPILGMLHVEGLTRGSIASLIKDRLISEDLVRDAVVIVEFLNMGVSVMGEVSRPGRYSIDRDRMTLLDALGMAGDLTIYGKRENVMVIRQEGDGSESLYRVNLCDSRSLHSSPAYYLRQDDIVYVEPNDVRARQSTVNGNNVRSTSFWLSLASLLTTLGVLLFK